MHLAEVCTASGHNSTELAFETCGLQADDIPADAPRRTAALHSASDPVAVPVHVFLLMFLATVDCMHAWVMSMAWVMSIALRNL